MEIFYITLTALGSIVVLFILTKIMGNRQMSQLSMFDYVNGITIGSIAAEMATSLEDDFLKPLTAMIVYGLVATIIAILTNKSIKIRRLLEGKTLILFDNNKIYKNNFRKSRLDLDEFLTQCRNSGYFNLSDIQTAILETNGKISFLPKSGKRPVVPEDLNIYPDVEKLVINIVMDGEILQDNLKASGNNEVWLKKQLKNQNNVNLSEIFLATCDCNNKLTVYKKEREKDENDNFK